MSAFSLDHSTFDSSPFSLTASANDAACWAGRSTIHARLERMCASYGRRADSSLDLVWANLGSGKSHALFRLAYLLGNDPTYKGNVISAFIEMPEDISSFFDLYRRIASSIPLAQMAECVIAAQGSVSSKNLVKAAFGLAHGAAPERELAQAWFVGDRPNLRDLKRSIGIDSRIEDDAAACDTLADTISALAQSGVRLLLLIDEFQRISASTLR